MGVLFGYSSGFVWVKTHLAANQRVVSVTVGIVIAASNQNTIQRGSSVDDEIQLVSVGGSRVPRQYSMVHFCGKERVGYTEVVVGA